MFTFAFKHSLRKVLVQAHAFYDHVSLQMLFNSKKKGAVHSCVLYRSEMFQISSLKMVHSLLWYSLSKKHNSLPCFSVGRGILWLFSKIYVNSFSNQIAIIVGLCVLGMYALFYAYKKSHCLFNVSQVLGTNWLFLLSYSWLVTLWSENCFYYCSEKNSVVVLFGTLKVRWNSCQGDGVKTRQPRHLQRYCP